MFNFYTELSHIHVDDFLFACDFQQEALAVNSRLDNHRSRTSNINCTFLQGYA